jgi:CBS domain-containing protein
LNKTVVADVMIKDVKTVAPDAELEDGIYLMRQNRSFRKASKISLLVMIPTNFSSSNTGNTLILF